MTSLQHSFGTIDGNSLICLILLELEVSLIHEPSDTYYNKENEKRKSLDEIKYNERNKTKKHRKEGRKGSKK